MKCREYLLSIAELITTSRQTLETVINHICCCRVIVHSFGTDARKLGELTYRCKIYKIRNNVLDCIWKFYKQFAGTRCSLEFYYFFRGLAVFPMEDESLKMYVVTRNKISLLFENVGQICPASIWRYLFTVTDFALRAALQREKQLEWSGQSFLSKYHLRKYNRDSSQSKDALWGRGKWRSEIIG